MNIVDKIIQYILYAALIILMFSMAATVLIQVFSRYILAQPFTWTDEAGRYIFVWLSFLGMVMGIRKGEHVALDILLQQLKNVNKTILSLIIQLLIAFFGIVLTYSGFLLYDIGTTQTSPSLQLSMNIVYSIFPISGILLILFVFINIISLFKEREGSDNKWD